MGLLCTFRGRGGSQGRDLRPRQRLAPHSIFDSQAEIMAACPQGHVEEDVWGGGGNLHSHKISTLSKRITEDGIIHIHFIQSDTACKLTKVLESIFSSLSSNISANSQQFSKLDRPTEHTYCLPIQNKLYQVHAGYYSICSSRPGYKCTYNSNTCSCIFPLLNQAPLSQAFICNKGQNYFRSSCLPVLPPPPLRDMLATFLQICLSSRLIYLFHITDFVLRSERDPFVQFSHLIPETKGLIFRLFLLLFASDFSFRFVWKRYNFSALFASVNNC